MQNTSMSRRGFITLTTGACLSFPSAATSRNCRTSIPLAPLAFICLKDGRRVASISRQLTASAIAIHLASVKTANALTVKLRVLNRQTNAQISKIIWVSSVTVANRMARRVADVNVDSQVPIEQGIYWLHDPFASSSPSTYRYTATVCSAARFHVN